MLIDLPPEILFLVFRYFSNPELLKSRATCMYFRNIINSIYFKFPNFRKRIQLKELTHLPIQTLRFSQIWGDFDLFPESLTNFIIDSRDFQINPEIIKKNFRVNFTISLKHLEAPRVYNLSDYLLNNVKIYTNRGCCIPIKNLQQYKDFTFKTLYSASIYTYPGIHLDVFDYIIKLKIERLFLDYLYIKISPERLIGLDNVVYISSNLFERNKEFPIYLCSKLPSLEAVHFKRNSFVNFDEFLSLNKVAINNTQISSKNINFLFFKMFYFPRQGIVRIRNENTLYLKKLPELWIQSLEEVVVYKSHFMAIP